MLLLCAASIAIDNGLGLQPPLGWRSWNQYSGAMTQKIAENTFRGLVSRARGGVVPPRAPWPYNSTRVFVVYARAYLIQLPAGISNYPRVFADRYQKLPGRVA